jgi:O-antigen ligase
MSRSSPAPVGLYRLGAVGVQDRGEPDLGTIARWRFLIGVLVALVFGIVAATAAIAVSGLATRYLAAMMVALAGLVGLPLLGSRQRARDVTVIALTAGLSVGFSISFLLRLMVPNKFVPFMGGAEGVTVSLTFVATTLYFGIWMFERYFYGATRPLRTHGPLFWPAVAFMAAGMLSLANAVDLPLSFLEEFRLLCLLGVTVAVMNLTPRELNIYLLTLAGSVMLQATLAAMQYATGRSFGLSVFGEAAPIMAGVNFEAVARPTGLFGDPNIMAYFFEITSPLMLALMFVTRDRLQRLIYFVATMAGLAGILVSLSRASWITVPVTFGFITLMVYGRRLLTLRSAIIGIVALGVIAAAAVYVWPIISARLLGDDAGSEGQRMPLNLAALAIMHQFPWVGVGLNNFAITFTDYDTTGAAWVRPDLDYVVHNLFLLVGTEVGGIGLAAFLWYFGSVFLATFLLPRTDTWIRAVTLGISAGLFAHLMHGMVDPGFKVNLTISELIAAQIGVVGNLCLVARRSGGGTSRLGKGATG